MVSNKLCSEDDVMTYSEIPKVANEAVEITKPAPLPPSGFAAFVARLWARLKNFIALLRSPARTLPQVWQAFAARRLPGLRFAGVRGLLGSSGRMAVLDRLHRKEAISDALHRHLACEQAINEGSPLVIGNRLTLLQNGPDTYAAMMAAIAAAREHINLETYIFDDDDIGRKFADLLLERQAAGVQVHVIYDSGGSVLTPASFFQRMSDAGIHVLEFNPLNPLAGNRDDWRFNNRDHRKQLLVDGRIAFIGGINITKVYSSAPLGRRVWSRRGKTPDVSTGWRDTHLQIEGPVVAQFQKMFIDTWTRQRGEPLGGVDFFPKLSAAGDEIVRAIGSRAEDESNPIYLTLMSAICQAEERIHITVAYFAPDPQMLRALIDAARRGVDVRLILPGYSDVGAVFHLGRSYYGRLLRGGVKIHERCDAVMHAKTVCIDGVWSTIGSTNLDSRSFLHNDEINAVILGRDFAKQMEAMFAQDLQESRTIQRAQWRRRGWVLRLKERSARFFAYWL
jgi:cardiolipin synthase A/B